MTLPAQFKAQVPPKMSPRNAMLYMIDYAEQAEGLMLVDSVKRYGSQILEALPSEPFGDPDFTGHVRDMEVDVWYETTASLCDEGEINFVSVRLRGVELLHVLDEDELEVLDDAARDHWWLRYNDSRDWNRSNNR